MRISKYCRRVVAAVLGICLPLWQASPALAYLKFGVTVGNQSVAVKWNRNPARYFVTNRAAGSVSASDLQAAVARALTTWQAVPTASITYEFVGFTAALPGQDDGLSTIGFDNRPDLNRVLGATSFLVDAGTGELLESDIFFNTAFPWSVAAAGEAGRYDLESIALHETGHFSGLGHSALGETELVAGGRRVIAEEAIMFPIAYAAGSIAGRTLRGDDIAGLSDLYPDGEFRSAFGSLSGVVTKNGRGVFGAHVVAFDLSNGSLVASYALDDQGRYAIAGLSPGPHVIRVEPLDDVDKDEVFDANRPLDIDFRVTFLDRVVVVPRGGDTGGADIKVNPK
jgi:hypothetical protein